MKRYFLAWGLIAMMLLAACQPIVVPPTPVASETDGANTEEAGEEASDEATGVTDEQTDEQTPGEQTDEGLYTDPQARFTVPIPTNWTAEGNDDYVRLTSPQEQIETYVVVIAGEDVEDAIAQAWTLVDPNFDMPVLDVNEVPSAGGIERTISVDYDYAPDDDSVVAAAVGWLVDGNVYALLVRGNLIAISQRSAQLTIIQTGLKFAGIEDLDLADVPAESFDDAMRTELESYIQRKLDEYGIPGAAVAVVQAGEIVYAQGFGVRELDGDEPITPETMMMIGSTGKTMTTMMMATVVDDGLMQWDTSAQEVLPQFAVADPALSQEITVRNLVCACTGVPRRDLQLIFNADELTAEDVVESLQEFQFFTDFGEAFQYSNQLVATGGYAAAAAAGAEWGDLYDGYVTELETRILEPIGMNSTTLSFDEVVAGGNYALPHTMGVETPYELAPLEIERVVMPVAPAGAHWSNIMDMARYLITLMNEGVAPDGTQVVSAENLAETWIPQVPVSAEASYGLGWFIDQYKGQAMIQHGGNTLGFTSDLAFLPEAGVGITIVTNGRATNVFNEAVRIRLFELLFDQPMEADAQADFAYQTLRELMTEPVQNTIPVDEEAVSPFLGSYSNPEIGGLELEWQEDSLFFDVGEFRMEVRAVLADEDQAQDDQAQAEEVEGQDEASADDPANATEYVIYGPPMTGLPLQLEMDEEGQPQVIFGEGVDEYIFTPTE